MRTRPKIVIKIRLTDIKSKKHKKSKKSKHTKEGIVKEPIIGRHKKSRKNKVDNSKTIASTETTVNKELIVHDSLKGTTAECGQTEREVNKLKNLQERKEPAQPPLGIQESTVFNDLLVEIPTIPPRTDESYIEEFNLKSCSVLLTRIAPPVTIKQEKLDDDDAIASPLKRPFAESNINIDSTSAEPLLKVIKVSNSPRRVQPEKQTNKITPMVSIPNEFMPMQNVLLDPASTIKRLRPWLSPPNSSHQKFERVCEEMMHVDCLSALYKCMSYQCSFYTSKKEIFAEHLSYHLAKSLQPTQKKNLFTCPYCDFRGCSVEEFINHITALHDSAMYQCRYCFYRSRDYFVGTHQESFHPGKDKQFIELNGVVKFVDVLKIHSDVKSFVPEMTCPVCKEKFYFFNRFSQHLNSHVRVPNSNCIRCNKETKREELLAHLKTCHGFGRYQCAFCRFGTDKKIISMRHLANVHPFQPGYFFERSHQPISSNETPNYVSDSKILSLRNILRRFSSTAENSFTQTLQN